MSEEINSLCKTCPERLKLPAASASAALWCAYGGMAVPNPQNLPPWPLPYRPGRSRAGKVVMMLGPRSSTHLCRGSLPTSSVGDPAGSSHYPHLSGHIEEGGRVGRAWNKKDPGWLELYRPEKIPLLSEERWLHCPWWALVGSTSLERAWERVLAGSQNNDGTWDLPELRHQQPATTKRCEMREERVWKLQHAQLPTGLVSAQVEWGEITTG